MNQTCIYNKTYNKYIRLRGLTYIYTCDPTSIRHAISPMAHL